MDGAFFGIPHNRELSRKRRIEEYEDWRWKKRRKYLGTSMDDGGGGDGGGGCCSFWYNFFYFREK